MRWRCPPYPYRCKENGVKLSIHPITHKSKVPISLCCHQEFVGPARARTLPRWLKPLSPYTPAGSRQGVKLRVAGAYPAPQHSILGSHDHYLPIMALAMDANWRLSRRRVGVPPGPCPPHVVHGTIARKHPASDPPPRRRSSPPRLSTAAAQGAQVLCAHAGDAARHHSHIADVKRRRCRCAAERAAAASPARGPCHHPKLQRCPAGNVSPCPTPQQNTGEIWHLPPTTAHGKAGTLPHGQQVHIH